VALWPYTGVIAAGTWSFVSVVVLIVTMLSGLAGRALFSRMSGGACSVLTLLVQVLALIPVLTNLLVSETAGFGFVPRSASVELTRLRLQAAVAEISSGVAPIDATVAISTAMGMGFAVVAVLTDHLIAHRLIVLTVLFTSVVGAVPMLLSFGSVNPAWFVMQGILILLVLRFGARHDRHAPRHSPFIAAGLIGVAAIAVTAVVAPGLPLRSATGGTGAMMTVSADLRLGDDLRRPEETEALTLVTSAAAAPYLRVATLSRFDGEVWRPDRSDRAPLADGFGERPWGEQIKTIEQEVSIRVVGMSSTRLPVPYAAEKITGLPSGWDAMALNRTVISSSQDAAGSDYTVRAASPAPTLEQIRATGTGGSELVAEPAQGMPAVIGELAQQVTADADTDYDRLVALQNWFRSEFDYSLDAPVEDGFDGTGAEAVETFLEVRSGYCVHFAGAFALMAQSLDMPVRIVVGYLPGRPTDRKRGDDRVYSVTSDQLHSWPEVFFRGIGWVPFEPTATLGSPTDFVSAAGSGGGDRPATQTPSPTASTASSPAATSGPDRGDEDPGAGGGGVRPRLDPTPVVLTGLGILGALLLPALLRDLRRRMRLRRARRGDAMAAWRELADTLVDLGIPLRAADTARSRAAHLSTSRGVDAGALNRLVAAVERHSYAERPDDPECDLATPLRHVLAQLRAGAARGRRATARLLPASLARRRSAPEISRGRSRR